MEQRKARFGEVNKTIDKNGSLSAQDKAKLRLERFSQPLKQTNSYPQIKLFILFVICNINHFVNKN